MTRAGARARASGRTVEPLGSVADRIYVGLPTSRYAAKRSDRSVMTAVLSVGDLDDGRIAPIDKIALTNLREENFDRFRAQPGDVLVSARGTILKVALVGTGDPNVVVSSNVITIRPDRSRLFPQVLFATLRSPPCRELLESKTHTSTGLMQLTVKDVQDLLVPVPSEEVQAMLAKLVDAEARAYESEIQTAHARRALTEALISTALWDGSVADPP